MVGDRPAMVASFGEVMFQHAARAGLGQPLLVHACEAPCPRASGSPSRRRCSHTTRPAPASRCIPPCARGTSARTKARRRGRCPGSKPLLRQARTKLAARRFTSHSQGAGRVSSRSLMSKISAPFRGGVVAEVEQMAVAARLHAQPARRRDGQVCGHVERRASIEGERRLQHASVANRDQLGKSPLVRLLEQAQRIRAAARRLPGRVRVAWTLLPQALAHRTELGLRSVGPGRWSAPGRDS